jgi:pyruvate/2-oxoglutarate dehydrogenase complex dihydrolipoamide dehydrogenase (E3) component
MKFDYDLTVIGGGAAGFVASKLAAGLGKRVALVEKRRLGGECTLYGCVPSKAFIRSADIARQARDIGRYGLTSNAGFEIGAENVMAHVRSVVEAVYRGHPPSVFEGFGIDVLFGSPEFIDNHHMELNGKKISSRSFIISTGSSPYVPRIEGLDNIQFLTNVTFWDLEKLPPSMIVLGGGPIGIELASAMGRLGVRVSVVERSSNILSREDVELARVLAARLREEGVAIHTGTQALKLTSEDGSVALSTEDEGGLRREVKADSVLVAVGRRANVEGLGLDRAGVEYDGKGIMVDGRLRTSAPNIYACGDVAGPYRFSHMAEYQARIAVQNALLPIKRSVDYSHVAWCTFTDPELAHAGMTEEEARRAFGDGVKVYRHEFKDIDRGKTDLLKTGMGKYIVGPNGKLLGVHILGSRAGEIIHEPHLAKAFGVPFHRLDSLIHIYPTLSDIVKQPAKLCRIDRLRGNFFIQALSALLGKRGR